MRVPDSLAQHNQVCQNMVLLAYKFYSQLIFLFLYVIILCVDQLFQQLLHQVLRLTLKHHVQQDAEVQN